MPGHWPLLVTLLSLGSPVISTHVSYRGGQQGPAARSLCLQLALDIWPYYHLRFVHFTKLVSRTADVDFSPLYGSLRITEPGLYSLSYSLQAGQGQKRKSGKSSKKSKKSYLTFCQALDLRPASIFTQHPPEASHPPGASVTRCQAAPRGRAAAAPPPAWSRSAPGT